MPIHLRSIAPSNDEAQAPDDYGAGLHPGERGPACYAASAVPSRGRQVAEPECPTRSPFQRDRDRILHSTAFRRLTHKTQVFVFHEGDHYRSRLTHSLEVAQIARTIARQLRLDEDLAEALSLAHDLGHSPFGHAGERALEAVMHDFGGFDHNAQSLRVVTRLERKYMGFDGLNLTWEALEGLAKHNGPVPDDKAHPNYNMALHKAVRRVEAWRSLDLDRWASAEAQVAAIADDIAYVSHDIDDGLRAGLLSLSDLSDVPLAGPAAGAALAAPGAADEGRRIYEVTRRLITFLIADVVREARQRLAALAPGSPDDIRAAGSGVVGFSPVVATDVSRLKAFLFAHVYRHARVMRVMTAAEVIVRDLFGRYLGSPADMPAAWAAGVADLDERALARRVGDFVAGMTDRYAMAEHRRLFDATPDLR